LQGKSETIARQKSLKIIENITKNEYFNEIRQKKRHEWQKLRGVESFG